jgi:hypothetical protein
MSFWVQFAINEMLAVLVAWLETTKTLSTMQQADGTALIAAAQKFIADF